MSTNITKDTIFVRPTGGNRKLHVINCSYIKNWNIEGCTAVEKFNPKKMSVCPTCETLVYFASGAKDYASNKDKYSELVKRFNIYPKLIFNLVFGSKCKLEISGERLYIRKKKDLFYIDYALDDVRLYHNNYTTNDRDNNGKITQTLGGFHEHNLFSEDPVERFRESIKQIINYKYEEAKKVHAKKKKPRITFDELDNEYWGFSS